MGRSDPAGHTIASSGRDVRHSPGRKLADPPAENIPATCIERWWSPGTDAHNIALYLGDEDTVLLVPPRYNKYCALALFSASTPTACQFSARPVGAHPPLRQGNVTFQWSQSHRLRTVLTTAFRAQPPPLPRKFALQPDPDAPATGTVCGRSVPKVRQEPP